jgi:hypothetical protein
MQPSIEKPKSQSQRLEPTGIAKPDTTCALMGTGPGLACQDDSGWVVGQFGN